MTEYEKAMVLLQMQLSDYLHVIACERNPAKAKVVAERAMKALQKECPTVVDWLRNSATQS